MFRSTCTAEGSAENTTPAAARIGVAVLQVIYGAIMAVARIRRYCPMTRSGAPATTTAHKVSFTV